MQVTDEMVTAALHGADYIPNNDNRIWMRAALTAALAEVWRPIGELTSEQNERRILVAGWKAPSGRTAGYWWWHEDNVVDGRPFDHPEAQFWCPAPFALPLRPKDRQ